MGRNRNWQSGERQHQHQAMYSQDYDEPSTSKRRVFKEEVEVGKSQQRHVDPKSNTDSDLNCVPTEVEHDMPTQRNVLEKAESHTFYETELQTSYETEFPDHCWVGEYLDEDEANTVPLTYDQTVEHEEGLLGQKTSHGGYEKSRPELEIFRETANALFPSEEELQARRRERLLQTAVARQKADNVDLLLNSLASLKKARDQDYYNALREATYLDNLKRIRDELSQPKPPPAKVFDYGHRGSSSASSSKREQSGKSSNAESRPGYSRTMDKRVFEPASTAAAISTPGSIIPVDRDFSYDELLEIQKSLLERPKPMSTILHGTTTLSSMTYEDGFVPAQTTSKHSSLGLPISVLTSDNRSQQNTDGLLEGGIENVTSPLKIKPDLRNFRTERKSAEIDLSRQRPKLDLATHRSFDNSRKYVTDNKRTKDPRYKSEMGNSSVPTLAKVDLLDTFFRSRDQLKIAGKKSSVVGKDTRQIVDSIFPFRASADDDTTRKSDESEDDVYNRFMHRRTPEGSKQHKEETDYEYYKRKDLSNEEKYAQSHRSNRDDSYGRKYEQRIQKLVKSDERKEYERHSSHSSSSKTSHSLERGRQIERSRSPLESTSRIHVRKLNERTDKKRTSRSSSRSQSDRLVEEARELHRPSGSPGSSRRSGSSLSPKQADSSRTRNSSGTSKHQSNVKKIHSSHSGTRRIIESQPRRQTKTKSPSCVLIKHPHVSSLSTDFSTQSPRLSHDIQVLKTSEPLHRRRSLGKSASLVQPIQLTGIDPDDLGPQKTTRIVRDSHSPPLRRRVHKAESPVDRLPNPSPDQSTFPLHDTLQEQRNLKSARMVIGSPDVSRYVKERSPPVTRNVEKYNPFDVLEDIQPTTSRKVERLSNDDDTYLPPLMEMDPIPALLALPTSPVGVNFEKRYDRSFIESPPRKLIVDTGAKIIKLKDDERRFEVKSTRSRKPEMHDIRRTIVQDIHVDKKQHRKDESDRQKSSKRDNRESSEIAEQKNRKPDDKYQRNDSTTSKSSPSRSRQNRDTEISTKTQPSRSMRTLSDKPTMIGELKTKLTGSSKDSSPSTSRTRPPILKRKPQDTSKVGSKSSKPPLKRKLPVDTYGSKSKKLSTGNWMEDYKLWFEETVEKVLLQDEEAVKLELTDPIKFLESVTSGRKKSMSYIPRGDQAKEMLKFIALNKDQKRGKQDESKQPKLVKETEDHKNNIHMFSGSETSEIFFIDKNPSAVLDEITQKKSEKGKEEIGNRGLSIITGKKSIKREYKSPKAGHYAPSEMKDEAPTASISRKSSQDEAIKKVQLKKEIPNEPEKSPITKPGRSNSDQPVNESKLNNDQSFPSEKEVLSNIKPADPKSANIQSRQSSSSSTLPEPIKANEEFRQETAPTTHTKAKTSSNPLPASRKMTTQSKLPAKKNPLLKPPPKKKAKIVPAKTPQSIKQSSVSSTSKHADSKTSNANSEGSNQTKPTDVHLPVPTEPTLDTVFPQKSTISSESKTDDSTKSDKKVEQTRTSNKSRNSSTTTTKTPSSTKSSNTKRPSQSREQPSSGKNSSRRPSSQSKDSVGPRPRNQPTSSRTRLSATSPSTRRRSSSSKSVKGIDSRSASSKAPDGRGRKVSADESTKAPEQEDLLSAFKKQVEKTVLRKLNILYKFEKYPKNKLNNVAKDIVDVFNNSKAIVGKEEKFSSEQALLHMKYLFDDPTATALDDIYRHLSKVNLEEPCFEVDLMAYEVFQDTVMLICHENLNPKIRFANQDQVRTRYVRLRTEQLFPQFDGEAHIVMKIWSWKERMTAVSQDYSSPDPKCDVKPFPEQDSYKSLEELVSCWIADFIKCPLYEYPEVSSCNIILEVKRQLENRKEAHASKKDAVALIAKAWLRNYHGKIKDSLKDKGHTVQKSFSNFEELMVLDEVYSDESDTDNEAFNRGLAEDLSEVQVIDLF